MTGSQLSHAAWRKSSHSETQTSECVEVARADRLVAVRDSKNPEGAVLTFSPDEWHELLADIKSAPPT